MAVEFDLTAEIPVAPEVIYHAWLDSEAHSAMTGSPAEVGDQVGDRFQAWDGYITGENLDLEPGKRILQAWRTSEFGRDDPDSRLEITLVPSQSGTLVQLRHSQLPPHGDQYEQGWIDNYFNPMKSYFKAMT